MTDPKDAQELNDLAYQKFPSKGESPNCSGHAREGYVTGYRDGRASLEGEERKNIGWACEQCGSEELYSMETCQKIERLHDENKKLRSALKFYAFSDSWTSFEIPLANGQSIKAPGLGMGPSRAREALKATSGDANE